MSSNRIWLSLDETGQKTYFDLHGGTNDESANVVRNIMPTKSIMGHVVVSGGGLWIPTNIVYTGSRISVKRQPGSVYFYPPMQSICITYGEVRESAFVNEIGRVPKSELENLAKIGTFIWDSTIISPKKRPVTVSLNIGE